jgi:chemotaxis signal transduction protein
MSDGETVTDASAAPTPEDERERLSVLLVEAGGAVHAVEAGRVGYVAEEFTVTRIPRTPPLVVGVGEIENEITVVVDATRALGESSATSAASRRVVQLPREGGDTVGLLVDGVRGFENVDVAALAPVERPPEGESDTPADAADAGDGHTNWFRATIEPSDPADGEAIGVLDVPYLLQRVATITRRDTHE